MRGFSALSLLVLSTQLLGCELIADFDRGKLDAGMRPRDAGKPPVDPGEPDSGDTDSDAGE